MRRKRFLYLSKSSKLSMSAIVHHSLVSGLRTCTLISVPILLGARGSATLQPGGSKTPGRNGQPALHARRAAADVARLRDHASSGGSDGVHPQAPPRLALCLQLPRVPGARPLAQLAPPLPRALEASAGGVLGGGFFGGIFFL